MSNTTTAYDAWISGQLEPNSVIITGNNKRHPPAFAQAWEANDAMLAAMGNDEYQERLKQDEVDKQRYYED